MTSQYGQDLFALAVLDGLRGGFFLDSGASDGVTVSNTLLLERDYGWRGICVEPNDRFFARLRHNRRCVCVNCCLYDRDATVDFIKAGTLGGIVEDYHPSLRRQVDATHRSIAGTPPTVITRPAQSVRSLLHASGAPPVIDYWSLDTEGSELRILKAFPFDEYAFRVLTVEHNRFAVRSDIRRFLEARGYRWVAELGCDDAYVADRLIGPRS
jgi:FkbM family methyltransferase